LTQIQIHQLKKLDVISKRRLVYSTIRLSSELAQFSIKKYLEENKLSFRSLWIGNSIYVDENHLNNLELIEKISKRSDVQEIISSRTRDLNFEKVGKKLKNINLKQPNPKIEWNLIMAKAPFIWSKGATGKGLVVANIDTGVYWNHTGLINQYRGYNSNNRSVNHDYNWYDGVKSGSVGCPSASKYPCDDHGHGTHTIGTYCGKNTEHVVGIAYDAKWIACRGFNRGFLFAGAVEGCMQYFLAPTKQDGSSPNPDLAPDVIGHSYGVPDSDVLKRAFAAVEAVGTINVASAGNSRTCNSITRIPGIYAKSFTVGALGFNVTVIASFSSKGPGPANYKRQKPEIAASGERVNSWSRGPNGITPMSGTSMSSPLVGSAVAAIWSAFPVLRNNIEETVTTFYENSDVISNSECGSTTQSPNFVYGYGNLNCQKVYENALKKYGK